MAKSISLIFFFLVIFISISTGYSKGDAPVISDLKVAPASGTAGTEITFSLRIVDPQGPSDIVQILYQIREGIEAIEVLLNDNGLDGDYKIGDGIYSGRSIVPKTAARQTHRFQVFVRDTGQHKSNLLEYQFSVIEGITI